MSVKHAISRGVELGRSAFQLGILKPAGRLAAKFRGERLRVGQPSRTVQPQSFLPARYQYYRMSLSGLAAQMQSGGFRRLIGGSPRNRVVFLAFGVGLGLIEQQFEDDRKSVAACQQIQVGGCAKLWWLGFCSLFSVKAMICYFVHTCGKELACLRCIPFLKQTSWTNYNVVECDCLPI